MEALWAMKFQRVAELIQAAQTMYVGL